MAFRTILIESPARLSLRSNQLIVSTGRDHSLPVEDLNALLLENRQSSITAAALSHLGQCGCAVFVCDEKHLPCAVLTPYLQHSRALAAAESLSARWWICWSRCRGIAPTARRRRSSANC